MAIIHQATLVPTKAELVASWLPAQPWFDGAAQHVHPVAAYRFDDPAGEVGIESHLFEVDGRLVHVPLTYRGGRAGWCGAVARRDDAALRPGRPMGVRRRG
jgi:hypothetical protein